MPEARIVGRWAISRGHLGRIIARVRLYLDLSFFRNGLVSRAGDDYPTVDGLNLTKS